MGQRGQGLREALGGVGAVRGPGLAGHAAENYSRGWMLFSEKQGDPT